MYICTYVYGMYEWMNKKSEEANMAYVELRQFLG